MVSNVGVDLAARKGTNGSLAVPVSAEPLARVMRESKSITSSEADAAKSCQLSVKTIPRTGWVRMTESGRLLAHGVLTDN